MVGEDLLLSIDPATVLALADGTATRFDLRFRATRTSSTRLTNLGAGQGVQTATDSDTTVPLTTAVEFNLSFGVDDAFFVQLPSGGIIVQSNIDAHGAGAADARGTAGGRKRGGARFCSTPTPR